MREVNAKTRELISAVISNHPTDIVDFLCNYTRNANNRNAPLRVNETALGAPSASTRAHVEEQRTLASLLTTRRRAVAGESYDPISDNSYIPPVHTKTEADRAFLNAALRRIYIFDNMDQDELNIIINAMSKISVDKNQTIIKHGEEGNELYIVQRGKFVAESQDGQILKEYYNSGYFGELALLYGTKRQANVRSISSHNILWSLDRKTFTKAIAHEDAKRIRMYDDFTKSVPLFQQLSDKERLTIADHLIPCHFHDGQSILKQGDPGDCMYFVERGHVRIEKTDEFGNIRKMKILNRGDYLGERALITQEPRAASAYAQGPTKLAKLPVDKFTRLLGRYQHMLTTDDNEDDRFDFV
ncbi:hypothetical protein GJ496_008817 [Pomphorhynchus laevis]|nr:hypothetical protein GJ496_008817 [Pomphorhynchus laevis]